MKKALVIMLAAVFLFAMASVALAAGETGLKTDGKPFWTYKDVQDSTAKNEGGYAPFSDADPADPYATGSTYGTSPHGGFTTTGNKCKVCHAVHRAEGAYFLLRADTQDDACDYCHIGGSAHSAKVVYELSTSGKSTANGHTIGASATVPDSSVSQWTEPVTLSTTDADGNTVSEDIDVRRYSNTRNKMFRFTKHHGQSLAGTGRNGYMRIGPLALRCMNCHQPHNATNMVWRPTDFYTQNSDGTGDKLASGYKLLRSMPSGSIWGTGLNGTAEVNYDEGMKTHKAYTEYENNSSDKAYVNVANAIKVPTETMSSTNTGRGFTIYTAFEGVTDPAHQHGTDRDPQTVNQFALSPWCADCHNLNIGYWKHPANDELGFKSHADRTHPAPYTGAYNGPAQCYSCHRNDLPHTPDASMLHYTDTASRAACESCHFGTGTYAKTIAVAAAGSDSGYDFPHSGQDNAVKLLGAYVGYWDTNTNSRVIAEEDVNLQALDGVCMRCHTGIGTNH